MMKLFIKINKESTSFILTRYKNVVFWESVDIGENNIINDLSKLLSLKFNNSNNLAKELVLKQDISFKKEEELKEIIEKKLIEIFRKIKEVLRENHLLKNIKECLLTRENAYILKTEKILENVMEVKTKVVDLKDLELGAISIFHKTTKKVVRELFE